MDEQQFRIIFSKYLQLFCAVAERKVVEFRAVCLQLRKKTTCRRCFGAVPSCGFGHLQNGCDGRNVLHLPALRGSTAYGILADTAAAVYDKHLFGQVKVSFKCAFLYTIHFSTANRPLQADSLYNSVKKACLFLAGTPDFTG